MRNKNGITLVELLVSIIIASIVILTAGGLSKISLSSFYKESRKQQIHNDLSYGLKLIRNQFRNSKMSSVSISTPASVSWSGMKILEIGNVIFGIFQPNNSSAKEFVFLRDKTQVNKCGPPHESNDVCEPLLVVPDGDITWSIACDPSNCLDVKAITIIIKRNTLNNANPFHMETTIARRNP